MSVGEKDFSPPSETLIHSKTLTFGPLEIKFLSQLERSGLVSVPKLSVMGLNNLREKATEKADRKFEKKVQFYSKVRSTIAATQTTKKSKSARKRAKKVKAYDLSTLTELLPELENGKRQAPLEKFKLNGKSRQQILLKEGKQFASVVSHPAFHSDPFGAIHQHLCSTQPVIEEPEKEKKKKKGTNGSTKRKGKKPVGASSRHEMEL